MPQPYLGEIQIYAFGFAPGASTAQWAFCDGAQLNVGQSAALFSLIGTYYGGDGTQHFRLPNFVNRVACNQGQGQGLSERSLGGAFGKNFVAMTADNMPAHNHSIAAFTDRVPTDLVDTVYPGYRGARALNSTLFAVNATANVMQSPDAIGRSGGNSQHENRSPSIAMTYAISLAGEFPVFPPD
ncbi:MAG TPA: tail fiber protein [Rhodopila sp.]|nr:tail fiber protein [Rhodopila sp.]